MHAPVSKKSITPQISLCLIARDEEQLLPGCLESVAGAVDQLVVVDTGSTDGTPRLAHEAGATVLHHAWDDDFAAARNVALGGATGDWILLLDADERLGPGASAAIRQAVATDRLDCGLLPTYQASHMGASLEQVLNGQARHSEPTLLPRLFRRTADLRWEGVVHENLRTWLQTPGRRVALVDAPVVHYGGTQQLQLSRDKARRNLRLLLRRVASAEHDADARTYLAHELWNAGEFAQARVHAMRAWDDVLAQKPREHGGQGLSSLVSTATVCALLELREQRFARALELIQLAISRRREPTTHPNLHYLAGLAQENMATAADAPARSRGLRAAQACYQQALQAYQRWYPDPVLPGATTWAAASRLGNVALQLKAPELALASFEAALETSPEHLESLLGRAEALLDLGRTGETMAQLRPVLAAAGVDGWILAAAALRQCGAPTQSHQCLRQAAETLHQGCVAPHREHRLRQLAATAPG